MGRKKHRSLPQPVPPAAEPVVKKETIVVSRAAGPMAWAMVEVLTTDPHWTTHVAADAQVVRVRVGDGWQEDLPGADGRSAAVLEAEERCLFLGVCEDDPDIVFNGMGIRAILEDEKDRGLAGFGDLLAGAPDVRVPGATFPETLPKITEMFWIMADNGNLDPADAEAASRALARAALARFRAGNAAAEDLNVGPLCVGFPELLQPHERIIGQALVGLDYAYRAAMADWGRNGRIRTVLGAGSDVRVAVCDTRSVFLADWLWDAESPDVVLRLEPGGCWCRISNTSGLTLAPFASALRAAAPDAAIALTGRDKTAGNRMRENPFLGDLPLSAAEIEDLLIRSLGSP